MQKKIEIVGVSNFSSVIKDARNLNSTLQNGFGKTGVQIFDKQSIEFLKTYSKTIFANINQEMQKLVKEGKELNDVLASGSLSEVDRNKKIEQRLANLRKISALQREAAMAQPRGIRGGLLSTARAGLVGVGQAAGFGPAMNVISAGAAGAAGAGGGAAAVAGGALGLGLAALTVAIMRATAAFDEFAAQVPNMLKGAAFGIGIQPGGQELQRSLQLGFTEPETIQQRIEAARAFGTRRSAAAQGNIVSNIQTAGRALGMAPEEIIGAGNQLRAITGPQESNRMLARILSEAMSKGFDASQASHFLSASVNLLNQINQNGLQSTTAFTELLGNLTRTGMAPEQGARILGNIQNAITGASGENAQFFRFAAARGGIGGNSLLGSIMAQQQGLTGINAQQFLKTTGNNTQALNMFRRLGLVDQGGYSQNFARGILKQLNATGFNPKTEAGFAARTQFLQQTFGLKTPQEAVQVEYILKKLGAGGLGTLTKKEKTQLEDLGKDTTKAWQDRALAALDNLPGKLAQTLAKQSAVKIELGKAATGPMVDLKDALIHLDSTITTIFGAAAHPVDTAGKVAGSIWDTIKGEVTGSAWMGGAPGTAPTGGITPLGKAANANKPQDKLNDIHKTLTDIKDAHEKTNKLHEEGNHDRRMGNASKSHTGPIPPPRVTREK